MGCIALYYPATVCEGFAEMIKKVKIDDNRLEVFTDDFNCD